MDEAAEGAIRLAKHRKSGRVDLKDMALSIGQSIAVDLFILTLSARVFTDDGQT